MTDELTDDIEAALVEHAEALRQAFDHSFAEAARVEQRETIDFVALRLGGDVHAVRMSEIGGLFTDVKVTPCPSPMQELRGIAAFRGALTPVYDLAQLLGYPRSSGAWMVLTADRTLALAFEEFGGHFRVEPSQVSASQPDSASRYVSEAAAHDDLVHPIVNIPSVAAAVAARIPKIAPSKE